MGNRKNQTRRLKRRARKTKKNLSKIRGGAAFNVKSLGNALGKGVGFNATTRVRASPKKPLYPKGRNVYTRRLTKKELEQLNKANEATEGNKANKATEGNKMTHD